MRRRGFLGMLGAAAAAPFIPKVIEASKKLAELRPEAKPLPAVEQKFLTIKALEPEVAFYRPSVAPLMELTKKLKATKAAKYEWTEREVAFESRYSRMRVQLSPDQDGYAQFENGVYYTSEPWRIEALVGEIGRSKEHDFWIKGVTV